MNKCHDNLLPASRIPPALRRDKARGSPPQFFPDLNISSCARAARCHQSHLTNILHAKRGGTLPLLVRIAKVLGLTMDEFSLILQKAAEAVKAVKIKAKPRR